MRQAAVFGTVGAGGMSHEDCVGRGNRADCSPGSLTRVSARSPGWAKQYVIDRSRFGQLEEGGDVSRSAADH